MTRGIVFFGFGKPFVDQAVAAAKRSMALNDVAHLVYCSEPPSDPGNVDIQVFQPTGPGYRLDRFACLLSCPFEEAIYLDSDCAVMAPIGELFDLLAHYDVAAAHAPGYRGLADPGVPASFFEINAGVLVFRSNERMRRVFREWRTRYVAWLENPPFRSSVPRDQPSFRHTIWVTGTPIYILGPEYNWRPWMNSYLCGEARIVHSYSDDYDKLISLANAESGPRLFPPLPGARKNL